LPFIWRESDLLKPACIEIMTALETLLEALQFYGIEIISVNGNHVILQNKFGIEVETNGLYKLFHDGNVVAPFDDINELCRFMWNS
jgi:hypothetical protein